MTDNKIKSISDILRVGIKRAYEDDKRYYVYLQGDAESFYNVAVYTIDKTTNEISFDAPVSFIEELRIASPISINDITKKLLSHDY